MPTDNNSVIDERDVDMLQRRHLSYFGIFCFFLCLLILESEVHASKIAATSKTEQLYGLLEKGKQYMHQAPDSACIYFLILENQYNKNLTPAEKEICVEGLLGKWHVYFYNYFDFPNSYEAISKALDILEENNMKNPEVNHSLGVFYQTLSAENNDENAGALAFEQYRKAFNDGFALKDEKHIHLYASNLFNHAYFIGQLDSTRAEWEKYQKTAEWGNRIYYDFNTSLYKGLSFFTKEKYDDGIAVFDTVINNPSFPERDVRSKIITLIYKSEGLKGRKDYEGATAILHQALAMAEKESAKDMCIELYSNLANCYTLLNDTVLENHYDRRYLSLKDSLLGFHQVSLLSEIQSRGKINKFQENLNELDRKNRTQHIVIIFSIIILILLSAMVLIIVKRNRKLRDSYRMLFAKNQENLRNIQEGSEFRHKYEEEVKRLTERISELENESNVTAPKEKISPVTESRYKDCNLSDSDKTLLLNRILDVMDNTDEYLSPDFTLVRLAELTESKYKLVSQIINERRECNFNTFINEYRINEACRRIQDKNRYGHLTLDSIAQSVGFKSRSAFIKAFKFFTGLTPSKYQQISGLTPK